MKDFFVSYTRLVIGDVSFVPTIARCHEKRPGRNGKVLHRSGISPEGNATMEEFMGNEESE